MNDTGRQVDFGMKLFISFIFSIILIGAFLTDFNSYMSWLISLLVAIVITAIQFWLLRPGKDLDPDKNNINKKYNSNALGITAQTGKLAIGSAEVSLFVDKLAQSIEKDQSHVNKISDSCAELTNLTDQVNHQVLETSKFTDSARDTSDKGKLLVDETTHDMSALRTEINLAADQLEELQHITDGIKQIADVINDIASQTDLLALNAKIEAARAGDAGRGFAVVAQEVGDLSKRTTLATADIESMVRSTHDQIQNTTEIMTKVVDNSDEMSGHMNLLGGSFADIAAAVAESSGAMGNIQGYLEGQVESVGQISGSINHVLNSMEGTGVDGQSASNKALGLSNSVELIYEYLADFKIDSLDHIVFEKTKAGVNQIQELFEQAIQSGAMTDAKLFSSDYRPIPNTDPQKYHSDFDDFTDKELPGIQEPILASHDDILYVVAQDINFYIPTYNNYKSLPLTGDYEKDLVNNRTKKIYNDRVGTGCGKNTKAFILQTYKRDIGDAVHDLSVPIYVKGKHWGCLRTGFKAKGM